MKHRLFLPCLKAECDVKLLFMSATNSIRTVADIKSILGVTMPDCFMLWGGARLFFKTNVRVRVYTYVQRKRHLRKVIKDLILDHSDRKFVVYSNFASCCAGLRKELFELLHDVGRSDYITLLTGEDFSEQKEFAIRAFVGDLDVGNLNILGAVFSLGLANAGVDNNKLYYGYVNEIPSSAEELAQVIGRFGRRPGSTVETDVVDVVVTLEGYICMLRRIYRTIVNLKSTKDNKTISEVIAKTDLHRVLRLLVLNLGCFQARMAN